MIAWMLYTAMVGLCIVAAAAATDWLARLRRVSVRRVWIVAALLCVVLPATARLRSRGSAGVSIERIELRDALIQPSVLAVDRRVPASATPYTAGLWSLAIVLIGVPFVAVYARLRRVSREWPQVELHGAVVRVSPTVGPVVIGAFRPEIVIPRWVLDRSPDQQRLVLAHEAAHIRARDPLVLGGACALVALMPWNPAMWIILSRIRLAIEIDCDARVLRAGASPRTYGSLLLDVAERASPLRFAMALSDGSSHLHQRILAMTPRRITHSIGRAASAVLIGLAALLAACEAKMPTAADIDRMDVAAAEKSARSMDVLQSDTSVVWSVDGVMTLEAAAKAIPADSIAEVSLSGLGPLAAVHIHVTTKRGAQLASNGETPLVPRRAQRADGVDPVLSLARTIEREHPLLVIDGKKSEPSALKALNQSSIAELQIMKGAAAIQEYGNDAKRGVVVVRTKRTP